MKFKTVAEAFNYYRGAEIQTIETRAKEIDSIISTDASADIEALNIELRGLKEAKENMLIKQHEPAQGAQIIAGVDFRNNEPIQAEGADLYSTAEYRSAFFKSLTGQSLTERETAAWNKAAEKRAFNSSADSGAVLPTTTLNEVIAKARKMGGLLAEARAFAVPTQISVPVGTPAAKAAWHTEGAAVEGEKVVTASVTFNGYEILKVFSLSTKVKTMSIPAFEAYLVDELTQSVYECIADGLVNGTGSGQGTGLEKGITWKEGTNLVKGTDYATVVKAIGLLSRGYTMGAKFAMNNATLYGIFYNMTDTSKRPIFIQDAQNDTIGKILGFDVIVDDNISNNVVYFGNFNKYLGYNIANGISVDVSTESSFKNGLIDYRAIAVADTKPLVTEAFIKIDTTTAA